MIDHEMEQTVSEIEAPVQAEELWEAAGGPFTSMGGLNNVLKRIYESFCSFFPRFFPQTFKMTAIEPEILSSLILYHRYVGQFSAANLSDSTAFD